MEPACYIRIRFRDLPNQQTQKGTVYEERDRFEGGCSGSRGGTPRLSGSETPPRGCRLPQITSSEASVGRGGCGIVRRPSHHHLTSPPSDCPHRPQVSPSTAWPPPEP